MFPVDLSPATIPWLSSNTRQKGWIPVPCTSATLVAPRAHDHCSIAGVRPTSARTQETRDGSIRWVAPANKHANRYLTSTPPLCVGRPRPRAIKLPLSLLGSDVVQRVDRFEGSTAWRLFIVASGGRVDHVARGRELSLCAMGMIATRSVKSGTSRGLTLMSKLLLPHTTCREHLHLKLLLRTERSAG